MPAGVPLVPGTGADGLAAAASAPEPGLLAKATRSGRSVMTSARAAASAEQEAQARQGRLFSATNPPEKPPGHAANGDQPKRPRGRPPKAPSASRAVTHPAAVQDGDPSAPPACAQGSGSSAAAAGVRYGALDSRVQAFLAAHVQLIPDTGLMRLVAYDATVGTRAMQLYDELKILRESGTVFTNAKSVLLTNHMQKLRQLYNMGKIRQANTR